MAHNFLRLTFVVLAGFAFVALAAGQEPKRAALEKRPLIVGHRGLLHGAPENTLAGFRACLALRFGFEFDVRRTKDGELVSLHDETLERTTNGKGRLVDLSFREVRRLDAGSRFDVVFRGEVVPTVEEILALAGQQSSDSTLIAVDLKEAAGGLEEAIVRLAEKHDVLGRLVFIGLTIESPEIRARLRAANPRAQLARLAATPGNVEEVLADMHADWVYVRFLPQPGQVRRIHQQGKRLFLAGPLVAGNEPGNWSKAAELGFDALLTDYPIDVQRQFRRVAP